MIWRKEQPKPQAEEQPRGFDDFELKLGDILRGERATLGKSLLDVQRELHIRAAHIAAIENGDLDAFEAPSFVAGFVRSYARYLGMDPEWTYERFCLEHGFHVGHGMAPGQASATPRMAQATRMGDAVAQSGGLGGGLRGVGMLPDPDPLWRRIEPGALGSISVLVALIAGLGFAGYTVLKEVQRVQVAPADVIPTVAADLDPLNGALARGAADQAVVPPIEPSGTRLADAGLADTGADRPGAGGAEGVVRIARPQALDAPVLVPRDGPIAAIRPNFTPAQPQTTVPRTDDAVAAALAEADVPQVVEQGPPSVQLLAVRPAWLRVRGADGSVIFERILDAGETYTIPQTEEPPTLHAGNSGSVYFLIDGQAFGPAAPGAQVVRNVSLDLDDLRGSFSVADLTTDADLAVFVASLSSR